MRARSARKNLDFCVFLWFFLLQKKLKRGLKFWQRVDFRSDFHAKNMIFFRI